MICAIDTARDFSLRSGTHFRTCWIDLEIYRQILKIRTTTHRYNESLKDENRGSSSPIWTTIGGIDTARDGCLHSWIHFRTRWIDWENRWKITKERITMHRYDKSVRDENRGSSPPIWTITGVMDFAKDTCLHPRTHFRTSLFIKYRYDSFSFLRCELYGRFPGFSQPSVEDRTELVPRGHTSKTVEVRRACPHSRCIRGEARTCNNR